MSAPIVLYSEATDEMLHASAYAESIDLHYNIIMESRSGSRRSGKARNPDYSEALETLLRRLSNLGGLILRIEVVSRPAMQLPAEDRVLPFKYPIKLDDDTNFHQLRVRITEAQRRTARSANVGDPCGGNNNKRICLRVAFGQSVGSAYDLAEALGGREA